MQTEIFAKLESGSDIREDIGDADRCDGAENLAADSFTYSCVKSAYNIVLFCRYYGFALGCSCKNGFFI